MTNSNSISYQAYYGVAEFLENIRQGKKSVFDVNYGAEFVKQREQKIKKSV